MLRVVLANTPHQQIKHLARVFRQSHCSDCHTVQTVTLFRMSQCSDCHTVQTVTLFRLSHCSDCHTVQTVTLFSLSHCSDCHTVQVSGQEVKSCFHCCYTDRNLIILVDTCSSSHNIGCEMSIVFWPLNVPSLDNVMMMMVMIFFFFFFFAFPIKVVTFRLRGWCVLGVFLLPAFTRLGHERQDLLSPCDEMHVCTD